MTSEKRSFVSVSVISLILILVLVNLREAARSKKRFRPNKRSRNLKSDDKSEKEDKKKKNDNSESSEEEEEEEESETVYVSNVYETKMIEFEDEIEGQTYLEAIEWEDRYWLDFHNLMTTVKGKLNRRQRVRLQEQGGLLPN